MDSTNGMVTDKYLSVEEDDQSILWDFLWNTGHKSEFVSTKEAIAKYPVIDSFTEMAEIGVYAYDEGVLVVTPTNPLLVRELPENIQKLLTNIC